jgi:hypothetical protein
MELFVFIAGVFVVLIVLARRNGAYRDFQHGDRRGSDVAAVPGYESKASERGARRR